MLEPEAEAMVDVEDLVPMELGTLRLDSSGQWVATDDVKGGRLDAEMVKDARLEEMSYIYERTVYKPSSGKECREVCSTGAWAR